MGRKRGRKGEEKVWKGKRGKEKGWKKCEAKICRYFWWKFELWGPYPHHRSWSGPHLAPESIDPWFMFICQISSGTIYSVDLDVRETCWKCRYFDRICNVWANRSNLTQSSRASMVRSCAKFRPHRLILSPLKNENHKFYFIFKFGVLRWRHLSAWRQSRTQMHNYKLFPVQRYQNHF